MAPGALVLPTPADLLHMGDDSALPGDHAADPFDERRLLGVFLRSMPDQVYFKDADGRFIKVSDELAKRFGFERAQDVVGKTDFDMFTEEHAAQAFADERRIIATGEPIIGSWNAKRSRTDAAPG